MVKAGVTTSINTKHQCITAMKEYENKSLEVSWTGSGHPAESLFTFSAGLVSGSAAPVLLKTFVDRLLFLPPGAPAGGLPGGQEGSDQPPGSRDGQSVRRHHGHVQRRHRSVRRRLQLQLQLRGE